MPLTAKELISIEDSNVESSYFGLLLATTMHSKQNQALEPKNRSKMDSET